MSQTNENEQNVASQSDQKKDLVGDTLRKERITRRITVETIARDLKLNVKYIKALEANEYNALPADPYVRVYLKSLAKYLSLDSEVILREFYKERGMNVDPLSKENSSRITISVKKEKETSRTPFLTVSLIVIAILAFFGFIAKKQNWNLLNVPSAVTPAATSSDPEFTESEPATDTALADSLIPATPPQPIDTSSVEATGEQTGTTDNAKTMQLNLSVVKDSVWVQVYSDGASWKNIVYKNQSREFSARDSFNVHVGNIAAVKFSFNGKRIPFQGKGVMVFKIDRSGAPLKWTLAQWNTVFNNRY